MARACCEAAAALHKAGIVHCDFRQGNVVRLSDRTWMVIDLEHCRRAADSLPEDYVPLADWGPNTLEDSHGDGDLSGPQARAYTELSDMHQIGKMLAAAMPPRHSSAAQNFIVCLREKRLDAVSALQHPWLTS